MIDDVIYSLIVLTEKFALSANSCKGFIVSLKDISIQKQKK